MARNLLSEHRISDQRFLDFSKTAGELLSLTHVRVALETYQSTRVRPLLRSGDSPAYTRSDNANNAVRLPRGVHLGTVLDLTRLGRVYAEAKFAFRMPEFSAFAVTDPRDHTQVNEFLSMNLEDESRRRSFLAAAFKAISRYRRRIEDRLHPTWAAEWGSLLPYLDAARPGLWLQAVGVPREDPVWLAVLRYPAKNRSREIKLFRPTQLDAGWYAHHFPSPPQAAVEKGGHTMFLELDDGFRLGPPPVSEFLHEQVDFTIGNWNAGGSLVGYAGRPSKGLSDRQRRGHLGFLKSVYGQEVSLWMAECV